MKKATMLLCLAVIFVAGSVMAQKGSFGMRGGQGGPPGMHKGMEHMGGPFGLASLGDITRAREELKLTDKQIDEFKKLGHDFRMADVDRRAAIEKAEIELNSLKMDRSANENAVMTAIDKLAMARAEQDKARYRFHNKMRSVLTDDQLQKWDDMMREHRGKFGPQMRGMGMGHSGWFDQNDHDHWDNNRGWNDDDDNNGNGDDD